ncbi:MAG: carbamoyl-phosphate synthase large subunit [Candidatus Kapabacteria bacterium]|nr:carbamoyl-phosphate synthase large subunit [Candidatus Kapabacteria bacterium]
MPKRTDIRSVLILGSGPIVIGQACEFDYSGTQACRVLREEGLRVILLNSNPATIMTDPDIADATYVEPITVEFLEKIIAKERPDALLPTMGGQTALNVAVQAAEQGVLERYGVEMIGANLQAIKKAEDRELFLEAMNNAGLEMARGGFVDTLEQGMEVVQQIGFPAIIRPSFTLGGTGGGVAYNMEEYRQKLEFGLNASPIHRVLVEESIIGWKEYELEVMRDKKDNVTIICSIENVDPMGVHTGDSITCAPAQTLTDREYQRMRDAAIRIMREIGVETGGSNVQFAQNPADGRLIVIEMNPRVSRSSALASKATGFPIAKIAAKLAIGYTLDEIPNDITRLTPASFEPTIDYVVVKIPRWDFPKFKGVEDQLGVQMKSVGEAMAFGRTFKEALQKAIRSLEQDRYGLGGDGKDRYATAAMAPAELEAARADTKTRLHKRTSTSIFDIYDALKLGISIEEIFEIAAYDPWFVDQMAQIVEMEQQLRDAAAVAKEMTEQNGWTMPEFSPENSAAGNGGVLEAATAIATAEEFRELVWQAKQFGFSDRQLAWLWDRTEPEIRALRKSLGVVPVFKTVDTCAAEFQAFTPYHYSTYEEENESIRSDRRKVIILGGGPNRIGQGIEFDYCCVHAVMALREQGCEVIMVNCNPETVSTDYDVTDKLYFEPLTFEDVMNIIEHEQPEGVIVSFGGQTPLKLAKRLESAGVRILGTSSEGIDLAEDRQRFGDLITQLNIPVPAWGTATSEEEAIAVAERVGYPVLVRPSYVLGGRAMEICYRPERIREYMQTAAQVSPDHPVLIDHFLEKAFEFDVDAVADGTDVVIGGVMQHIEEAGVHSGDSSCVLPPYNIERAQFETIVAYTRKLARGLNVVGPVNIQFAMQRGIIYVLEVNPRASRTIPFVSKATGIPFAKIAARVMAGEPLASFNLRDMPMAMDHVSVKESVFPFSKFPRSSMFLGPEMRSTGEVMGIDSMTGLAVVKARIASGNQLPDAGTIFATLSDNDKRPRVAETLRGFAELGFTILATDGTSRFLTEEGIPNTKILKIVEGQPNVLDYIRNGEVRLVINTPSGEVARDDEKTMGAVSMEYKVPFITTASAAAAALSGLRSLAESELQVQSLQEWYRP